MIRTLLASTAVAVLLSASVVLAEGGRKDHGPQAGAPATTSSGASGTTTGSSPTVTPTQTPGQGAPGSVGDPIDNTGKTSKSDHRKGG